MSNLDQASINTLIALGGLFLVGVIAMVVHWLLGRAEDKARAKKRLAQYHPE